MLTKEIPFVRIGLPICLGIITGLYFKPGHIFLIVSLLGLILGFLISLLLNSRLINYLYGCNLTIALYLCGLMLYTNERNSLSDLSPESGIYLCALSEYPLEKKNNYTLIVRLYSTITDDGEMPLKGSLLINLRKDSIVRSMRPGDFLNIRCVPVPVVNRGNPDEFNYRFYLENRGIRYYSIASADDILGFSPPTRRRLKHKALIIRERIITMYKERGINDDRLGLVAALTLGQKNMLDPEQKQIFIKAGVMHIMAVSGLHAVILSLFLFNLLFFMKGRLYFLRSVITILLLWLFAFITGLTPSVLRATLMFTFLHTGKLINRNVNNINSVLASAFVLILIHPSVLFDSGFLLSYSAVIFIICFYRDFYLKLSFKSWIADKIWQSAAVTILAQAGTLPLTITLFNRFPVWFILTNIVIVPLSSLSIIIGCLIPITYPFKFISQSLAAFLNNLTGFTELLTAKAASLPFSNIENIGMGHTEAILLFCSLFVITCHILKRRFFAVYFPMIVSLLFILAGTVRHISNRISNELIVYKGSGSSYIGLRTGTILNLCSDTDTTFPEVARHCATDGLRVKRIKSRVPVQLLRIENKTILICNNLTMNVLQKAKPDIIIINGKFPQFDKKIDTVVHIKALVISSEVVSDYRLRFNLDKVIPDTVHSVVKSGAFRLRL